MRKDDVIVVDMGVATNPVLLATKVGRDDLIIWDAPNHASIVMGARDIYLF